MQGTDDILQFGGYTVYNIHVSADGFARVGFLTLKTIWSGIAITSAFFYRMLKVR